LQLAGSIAVAERGVCTYLEKASAVESSGATAMLLVNDKNCTCGSRVRAL
jgi:signal peptide peptidase-like protein 2B